MEFYHEFGPGFNYHFEHNLPSHFWGSGLGAAMVSILVLVGVALLAVSLVTYVLQAIALQTMAQKRGLGNAWLAWVPVGSSWLMGALADHINDCQGKKTNYGIVLLVVTAASAAGGASLFLLPLLGLFSLPLSLAVMVLYYITLYEIYQDYAPKQSALFLVISILFSVPWLLLFVLRNRRPVTLGGAASAPQPSVPTVPVAPAQQPEAAQPLGWSPCSEEQAQAFQPPLGWSPCPEEQPQVFQQPQDCPPEHWGGIMTVQDTDRNQPTEQESDFPNQ